MENYFYLIIAGAVLLLIILVCAGGSGKRKGRAGERKTNAVIKKFIAKNGGRMLSSVWLPLYDGVCETDHIVFGSFGVAVIETKAIGGQVTGSGKYLRHIMGKREHKLYNPNMQNKTHVDNIRHHLLKADFRDVPMFAFVVFTDENIVLDSPQIGIRLSELDGKLRKLPAKRCDYKGMYRAIASKRVHNPIKKLIHNAKAG